MQINYDKNLSITERILKVIDIKGITKYKFCKDLGVSKGFLDKSREISTDKYANILVYFPDISPEWLLTGNGEMLKSAGTGAGPAGGHTIRSDVTNQASGMSMDVFWDRYDKVVAERDRLRAQVAELQREKSGNTSKAIYADDPEKLVAAETKIYKK